MEVTCRVDTSNLMRAHTLLHRKSRSLPSEAVHRTVAFVLKDAKDHTDAVPQSRIDSELRVSVSPRIGKRGKPLSQRLARNRLYNGTRGQGAGAAPFADIPLAWLLISARANAETRFNELTGWRWLIGGGAIGSHPLKGHRVGEFAAIMQSYVSRMTKSRHSSTGFFKISWNAIGQQLIPFLPPRYQGAARTWFAAGGKSVTEELGSVEPAARDSLVAVCTIENRIGMDGGHDNLDAQRNRAMHQILGPILQSSINREAESKMRQAHRQGLYESRAELAACGVTLT